MNDRRIAACLLAVLAALLITLGALRGESKVVMNKAVNICLECIGLG